MNDRAAIEELVYRSCMFLDSKQFDRYLDLCADAFHYRISTYSPEIGKEMTWLEHDKTGLKLLFNNLPKHNSDHSLLTRHAVVYTVEPDEGAKQAKVVSALQIFRTTLDGGATELFAVGKLADVVSLNGEGVKLIDRDVKLDTRMLGIGNHIPF
jgi:methanesulfonate monooxygenase subunit beta